MMENIDCTNIRISVLDKQGVGLQVVKLFHTSVSQHFLQYRVKDHNSRKRCKDQHQCPGIQAPYQSECTADTMPVTVTKRRKEKKRVIAFRMDPLLASCVICELQRSLTFREAFTVLLYRHHEHWQSQEKAESSQCSLDNGKAAIQLGYVKVILQLSDLYFFRIYPDIQWSNRMLPWWTIRLVVEDAFAWLSTLGGAYSSLGERFTHCAVEAGRLSLRQLYLAVKLGDPLLQARCHIYMALSLMQRGFLRHSKQVIRTQYRFAVSLGEYTDTRLIAMCHGVWCHLRFYYQRRTQRKKDKRPKMLKKDPR